MRAPLGGKLEKVANTVVRFARRLLVRGGPLLP
jgi:hypothetical protein